MKQKQEFKICTVIQGKSLETFLKNLKKAQASATMVELRADDIKGFKIEDVATLKKATKVPVIFTFRHKKEGGLFGGAATKQKAILKKAFDLGFTYIDVADDNSILKELSAKEKKHLLISWHNHDETPSIEELENILTKMRLHKPAAMKFAALVNHKSDIPVLEALLKKKKKTEKLVVIGMGKKGEVTRLNFPKVGSYIAYVVMKGEKNIAPGILTAEDFKK